MHQINSTEYYTHEYATNLISPVDCGVMELRSVKYPLGSTTV